jgi:hypothetical protein
VPSRLLTAILLIFCAVGAPSVVLLAEETSSHSDDTELVHKYEYRHKGEPHRVEGRILIRASNGVLLQSDDGALYTIEERDVEKHEETDEVFEPATFDELALRLLAEMPDGFRIHTTEHYVVCYGTSREYAQWTSSLLERLHRAFTRYWQREGFELHEPQFPFVAMVFPDHQSYARAAAEQVGTLSSGIVGYYSLQSNRVNMYDLTGMEMLRGSDNRRGSLKEINQMLSRPEAIPLVATIVHEATHQIAFNCGLHTRYSDTPLWLVEGMAIYFEAPDLGSTRGWRGIGKVNYPRLATFRRNFSDWNTTRLMSLLADDKRLRNPRTGPAAYADAWALNYYLIKYRPHDYTAYLRMLAEKKPLVQDDPDTRLAEFREHFGDIQELEQDFLRKITRVD